MSSVLPQGCTPNLAALGIKRRARFKDGALQEVSHFRVVASAKRLEIKCWDAPVIKGENLSVVILGLDPRIHVFQLLDDGEVDPRLKGEDDGRRGSVSHQRRAEANSSASQGKAPDRRRVRVVYRGVARPLKPFTDLTTRRRRACGRGRRRRACIWGRGGRRGCRTSAPCRVRRGAHRPVPGWPRIPRGCHPARWRG